jgi:hypothetical protein
MKAWELLKKLEEGCVLYRIPKQWDYFKEDPSNLLYFFYAEYGGKRYWTAAGFGSAGNSEDYMMSIVKHPENWAVHEATIEQRPWDSESRYTKLKKLERDWKYESGENS